jgi:hypothetical protein
MVVSRLGVDSGGALLSRSWTWSFHALFWMVANSECEKLVVLALVLGSVGVSSGGALARVWAWSSHASFSIMTMSGFEGMVVGRWEDHEGPKSSWMVEESMT